MAERTEIFRPRREVKYFRAIGSGDVDGALLASFSGSCDEVALTGVGEGDKNEAKALVAPDADGEMVGALLAGR